LARERSNRFLPYPDIKNRGGKRLLLQGRQSVPHVAAAGHDFRAGIL